MTDRIEALRREMEEAAAAMDFERAGALRDQISILRGAADPAAAEPIDTAGLARQQPGSLGLGTSQQRYTPPTGWVKPAKPDPMTRGRSRKR